MWDDQANPALFSGKKNTVGVVVERLLNPVGPFNAVRLNKISLEFGLFPNVGVPCSDHTNAEQKFSGENENIRHFSQTVKTIWEKCRIKLSAGCRLKVKTRLDS